MKSSHRKFLSTYKKGTALTLQELADKLGCSYKTVANNKTLWESRGVTFRRQVALPFTREGLSKASINDISLVKAVVNALSQSLDSSAVFLSDDIKHEFDRSCRRKDFIAYLTRFVDKCTVKVHPDVIVAVHDLLLYKTKKPKAYIKSVQEGQIEECFLKVHGFLPTKEQVHCVFQMIRHLTGGTKVSHGLVQAVAGSSKSTCIKVAQELMKILGYEVPHVVSLTHKALRGFENTSTVYKFLTDLANIETVDVSEESVKRAVKLVVTLKPKKKVPYLIVDEYSVISDNFLEALSFSAEKVIFVGDSHQLSNGTLTGALALSALTEQFRFRASKTDLQVSVTKLHLKRRCSDIDKLLEKHAIGTFKGILIPTTSSKGLEARTHYTGCFDAYKSLFSSYRSLENQIVVYSKAASKEINSLINEGLDIKIGSKVLFTKIDYKNPYLIPGTLAQVVALKGDVASCITEDNELFEAPVKNLELAFALTSTRAQGSAWTKVLAVLGTSHQEGYYKDVYSILTRATQELDIIYRSEVDKDYMDILEAYNSEEGNRNSSLYTSVKSLLDYMTDVKGLTLEEAEKTQRSAQKLSVKTKEEAPQNFAERSSSGIPRAECERSSSTPSELQLKGSNRYGLIIDSVHPTTEQTSMTEKQASYRADQLRKNNKEVTVVENLKNGNRVVIDLDSKEAVEAFKDQLEQTEAYIGDGTVHLVYTVDKEYKTLHSTVNSKIKGDFLGNSTHQLRKIKPNKAYNNKEAVPLPSEVYERFLSLIK